LVREAGPKGLAELLQDDGVAAADRRQNHRIE
jgi:hypothetical protein